MPSGEINILAMVRAILWVALTMLEIMGRRRVFDMWILGWPYNVRIVGWSSMRKVQFFCFLRFFKKSLMKEIMFLLMGIKLDIS